MEGRAEPGDYVEVSLMKKECRGTLLETPKDEKDIMMLKLDSGYNVGFNKKDVLEIEVLKKRERAEGKIEIVKDGKKPSVAVIMTGGTMASRLDPKTGGVDSLETPEEFFKYYPELFEMANVAKIEVPFMKSSEDMDFRDWKKIALVSSELLNRPDVKGIIITHGTDFLHYTSAALSFFLKDLNKPVVLTYSQKSVDRASSDARLNLKCSALAALSDMAEVMLVGHGSASDDFCLAMPGTRTRKMHTSKRDAFKVVNGKPIAKIRENGIETISRYGKRKKTIVKTDAKFQEKIALVKTYPGQKPDVLEHYKNEGYKGMIIETSGLGHVPVKGKNSWLKKIKEAGEKMFLCATSQCINGKTDPFVYSNGRELLDAGVIYLKGMLSETAFVKMGWVLGHGEWTSREKFRQKMLENVSGEID